MPSMLVPDPNAVAGDARGFQRMFAPHRLTLGVFLPIEAFKGDQPAMRDQERLAGRAEELGFSALWLRDVPLRDPSFGDIGQVFDPWVYLGWIAAQTREIALATGSLVIPLRHPLHTAKAAASIDQLSNARLVLGVASGDRPVEFPAFGVDHERRAELFRENLGVLNTALYEEFPVCRSAYGEMSGAADLVPKPLGRIPLLLTGHCGQRMEWIARNADGWITYPRGLERQAEVASHWRRTVDAVAPGIFKPFVQSFYIDLADDPDEPPTPIHLGFRGGRHVMFRFLDALRVVGVNHVILNLKYGARDAAEVLDEIGQEVLPQVEASSQNATP